MEPTPSEQACLLTPHAAACMAKPAPPHRRPLSSDRSDAFQLILAPSEPLSHTFPLDPALGRCLAMAMPAMDQSYHVS
jgi:hypothetical protein